MKPSSKQYSGFTLVEMLVSMVLLSMVLLISSGAYSLFSERWNGRLGHFNKSVVQAKQLILIQEALNSITSYVVNNDNEQAKFYFEGNTSGFVAVTLRSLFSPETAAVMRIQIVQNPDFTYKLTYQESLMATQLLISTKQSLNFNNPIILFDDLTKVNFQYFGWPSAESKNWTIDSSIEQPKPAAWFNEYNSLMTNLQPEQIKITFTNADGDFTFQSQLTSSVPGVLNNYADID
ncbi:MAG: prepilin-type N-terminal cleavage/methylation domain-containing protein [Psychroserpens sp.]